VDLADRRLGIVVEADSFAWHGDRTALRRDSRRYDLLVANGWVVLRFSWEDVMHDQDFVRSVIQATVVRTERALAHALSA
jgi:very-short-patch-repair endonuclease